jgi:hypothetical protein
MKVLAVIWKQFYCPFPVSSPINFVSYEWSHYKTIMLPVVLYGCETWSLTLREEHRLRVFENKVLRRIFVSKRHELTGGWRKLHNEELHSLYSSRSIIRNIKSRRMKWEGHVLRMGRRGMHVGYWWGSQ